MKKTIFIVKEMAKRYSADNVSQVGGTLAFFFILSIFPFMMFLNALLVHFNINVNHLLDSLSNVIPNEVTILIQGYLRSVVEKQHVGILPFALIMALYTASKATTSLIINLNLALKIKEKRNFILNKIISIIFTLVFAFVIIITLVISTLGKNVLLLISEVFHVSNYLITIWIYFRWLLVFLSFLFTITLLYMFAPNVNRGLKQSFIGSIFTSITLMGLLTLFSRYINNFANYGTVYGSLGAIIILMLMLYITGVIIMVGAQLNQILYEINQKDT